MSDIGFYGLTTGLVGIVMLAIAFAGIIIEAVILLKRRSNNKRIRLLLLGPLFYALVALSMLYIADESTLHWKRTLDDSAVLIAALALLPWIAPHLYQRRSKQQRAKNDEHQMGS
ncbi:MAG: hypothetical protein WBD99_07725 [Thermodesulfobacteriota bacterium]